MQKSPLVLLYIILINFSYGQLITFDDQSYTNGQNLSNPFTINNNGENFVFTISNGAAPIATNQVYRTSESSCGNSGLSYVDAGIVSATTWTIETQSGNEVDLGTIRFDNIWTCFPTYDYALTIEGFKNTISTGSQSFTATDINSVFTSNSNFDDVDKIVITCSNLAAMGIDDISWTSLGPSCSNPTIASFVPTDDVTCEYNTTTLTVTGSLNDATAWHLYTDSCDGTLVSSNTTGVFSISPSESTTYYVRGEDGAGCVTEAPSSCSNTVVIVASSSVTSTLTFGDQGYVNSQLLGNPYTLMGTNGSKLRFSALGATKNLLSGQEMRFFNWNGNCAEPVNDILTVGQGATPIHYVTIASTVGEEFDLTSLNLQNLFANCFTWQYDVTIEGYKNGASTGAPVAFTILNLYNTFTAGSNFNDIDSLVIYSADNMGNVGIDDVVFKLNTLPCTPTIPCSVSSTVAIQTNVSCNGFTDGQVTGSATGGTTPYTYSWNTGGTTATETSLGAGTYSVTITDANGCTDSSSVTLTQPTVVASSASVTGTLDCNGDTDGQVTGSATGGTTPYTYSWNTGGTTAIETSLGAGTYSVTITDANGCTDSSSVTLTEPAVLVAAGVADSNTSCNGFADGGATSSATGGTMPYTYSWSNSATTASITGVIAGTYSVTITDANGCTDSASTTVTEPTSLVAAGVVDSNVSCNSFSDGGATSSATGGTGAYTYSWSNSATTASITGVVAGTYSVTVTDANGCTDSSSTTVTESATLVASSVVDSNTSCNGFADGGATSSATGGTMPYTYGWSNSATTASITGVVAGTYSLTITDANGCTDSVSTTITEPAILSINLLQVTNTECDSTNGSLSVSGMDGTAPYSYLWSNTATTDSIGDLGFANYIVTVTDNNSCEDDSTFKVRYVDPTCDAPINLRTQFIQDTGATLKWDKLAGAISYKVVIKEQGNATWDNTYFTGSNVAIQKVTNLTPNTKYKWSVMARRVGIGWTRLALPAKFTSLVNPCINPEGIFVSGRSHDQVKLNWVNEINTLKYRITYREKGTSSWLSTTATAGSVKKWLTGLKADTEYEWKIKSVCEFGISTGNQWSAVMVFKTRPLPPARIGGGSAYGTLLEEHIEWAFYPNPTNGLFTVEITSGTINGDLLSIYDISGKSVYTTNINNTRVQIDLSQFDQGIYLLNYAGQHKRVVLTK